MNFPAWRNRCANCGTRIWFPIAYCAANCRSSWFRTPHFQRSQKSARPPPLSKKWITDILRKKIGYRGLICSDDLEMGGVLAAAPIEQAAIEQVTIGHIRAGGDLGLICHQEDFILRAHEALVREAERDGRFSRRAGESARRVLAFKKKMFDKKSAATRRTAAPTSGRVEKLTRQLWEFGEEIRLATLARADNKKERA
jgi:beta-N-acetylhexosaminidase